MGNLINSAADFFLYTGIRDYIYARISLFTETVLSNNLSLALTIILALLTLWVMVQGYLIATGRSQENLKGFLFGLGKIYFIIVIALGASLSSNFGIRLLTEDLADGISQVMHGNSDFGKDCLLDTASGLDCKIDRNLAVTQTVLSSLNALDTADDDHLEERLNTAKWFAGVGTAGPAVVAGTMLIVYRIMMALFIGFAPIFILCLLFKKTTPIFQKWLQYGLATIFSTVLLGVMTDISMELIEHLWVGKTAGDVIGNILIGKGAEGVMQTVTQQLGVGLILSTLLITVPPMAGAWFNGLMGQYSGWNTMSGWNGGTPQSAPPGIAGSSAYHQQVEQRVTEARQHMGTTTHGEKSTNTNIPLYMPTASAASKNTSTDVMRTESQIGYAAQSVSGTAKQEGNTDKTKADKGEKA